MFEAKEIDFAAIEPDERDKGFNASTSAGYGFAVTGGVAAAVAEVISQIAPEREAKIESATGLRDCRKMLLLAKAGKRDGYLLEGMACPGGCVAGAGTIIPVNKATITNQNYKKELVKKSSLESMYLSEEDRQIIK